MPHFCRHNRLAHRCLICGKSESKAASGETHALSPQEIRDKAVTKRSPQREENPRRGSSGAGRTQVSVRQAGRIADDGFSCPLISGIKLTDDASRFASEIAVANELLNRLQEQPWGVYSRIKAMDSPEDATWLGFLTAFLSPNVGPDPFESIERIYRPWRQAAEVELVAVDVGPRSALDPHQAQQQIQAYIGWVERAGSQQQAFTGDPSWSATRRFARLFERLSLPGFHREARFDLLNTLGTLGLYSLEADSLQLKIPGPNAIAAKRVFGIGDAYLLERRASELSEAAEIPLATLDIALYNWANPNRRATFGFQGELQNDSVLTRLKELFGFIN